jgi:hypothetical protein
VTGTNASFACTFASEDGDKDDEREYCAQMHAAVVRCREGSAQLSSHRGEIAVQTRRLTWLGRARFSPPDPVKQRLKKGVKRRDLAAACCATCTQVCWPMRFISALETGKNRTSGTFNGRFDAVQQLHGLGDRTDRSGVAWSGLTAQDRLQISALPYSDPPDSDVRCSDAWLDLTAVRPKR